MANTAPSARSQLTMQYALTRTRPVLGCLAILSGIPTPGPKRQERPFSRGIASLGAPQTGFRFVSAVPGPATRGYGDRPGDPVVNVIVCPAASAELDPGEARAHTEDPDQLRAHAVSLAARAAVAG